MEVSTVRFSDDDREALREAAAVLLEFAGSEERPELGYMAGRLNGLAGRVPFEQVTLKPEWN